MIQSVSYKKPIEPGRAPLYTGEIENPTGTESSQYRQKTNLENPLGFIPTPVQPYKSSRQNQYPGEPPRASDLVAGYIQVQKSTSVSGIRMSNVSGTVSRPSNLSGAANRDKVMAPPKSEPLSQFHSGINHEQNEQCVLI